MANCIQVARLLCLNICHSFKASEKLQYFSNLANKCLPYSFLPFCLPIDLRYNIKNEASRIQSHQQTYNYIHY